MDKKLQDAFQEQIKNELYSAYLYLSMATYSTAANLDGFSHWMRIQVKEEVGHAMKMVGFLADCGVRVILQAIPQPPTEFASPKEIFEKTLEHEKKVTSLINNLYDLSVKVNDHASTVFLQWFVKEQVEEEKNATRILEHLKMIKPDSSLIIMLDRELGKREAG